MRNIIIYIIFLILGFILGYIGKTQKVNWDKQKNRRKRTKRFNLNKKNGEK